jgi:hypothetical protein
MTTLRISERTTMDDVLGWKLADCEMIRITRTASFEPGAQGLALSALAGIKPRLDPPILSCEFDEPGTTVSIEDSPLATAFAFAAIRLVKRIEFNARPASANFKLKIGGLYKEMGGIFGSGRSKAVVCADPVFSIPPALARLNDSSEDPYPPPSAFLSLLGQVVHNMGFKRLLVSSEETGLINLVYESLRNSQEHGISSDVTRRSRSTRALIVEKLVLQGDLSQRQLSPELLAYAERVVEMNRDELGLGIVCLTVADQGDGIQETLPPNNESETADARLARAFEPGESRKPAGIVRRGQGLPSVISSAHRLQALVRITSGCLQVGQDFSLSESKYPQLDFANVRHLNPDVSRGTTISIFFPEFAFDIDQKQLFGR